MDDVTVAMPTFIIDELDPRDTFFPTTVGSVNQCKPSDIHIYVIQDLLRNTFFYCVLIWKTFFFTQL